MEKIKVQKPCSLLTSIDVILRKNIYVSEKNAWVVATVQEQNKKESITATGYLTSPQEEEYYQLNGIWYDHPTYGRQFKFENAYLSYPKSKPGIISYLCSDLFPGIGKKTAEKIVQEFAEETLTVLNNNPEKLKSVKGLDNKKINKILTVWTERKKTAETFVFLYQHAIGAKTAQKIIDTFGEQTIAIIRSNPYVLSEHIKGIAFLTADRMGLSLGIPYDSPHRIEQGILYILKIYSERGHCYITKDQLTREMISQLSLNQQQVIDQFDYCIKNLDQNSYIIAQKKCNHDIYFLPSLYLSEKDVCDQISKHLSLCPIHLDEGVQERVSSWVDLYRERSQICFSKEQLEAIKGCIYHKFFIITGGPGVGKTTVSKAIIKMFKAMRKSVLLAAPTGRAAKRLSEVSGENAKTIHRLLEWSASEKRFLKSKDSPLKCDVLIIDEASMIDIKLSDHLISALSAGTQMIWIGDVDQLPSVGPGKVLCDLLESKKIPFQKLTTIYRQALGSKIIENSHKINQGRVPIFEGAEGDDCFFIESKDPKEITSTIEKIISMNLTQSGYDSRKDVQILTPLNKGPLGSQTFNQYFQDILNPKSSLKKEYQSARALFRSGDKVIQLQNNYDLGVFNGDIGFISSIDAKSVMISVDFGDKTVQFSGDQIDDLALSYAITIHKSQGSEFPAVIIPISMSHFIMLQKNLIYTGLTRAKKIAIFVGEKKALAFAVKNEKSFLRQTTLEQRLQL